MIIPIFFPRNEDPHKPECKCPKCGYEFDGVWEPAGLGETLFMLALYIFFLWVLGTLVWWIVGYFSGFNDPDTLLEVLQNQYRCIINVRLF